MANHKSAAKRARQTIIKTKQNRFFKSRVKSMTKDVLEAVQNKDKEKATEVMKKANKFMHHTVSKGVFKKETISRKVGRLQLKVNSI
jgi:small subunit ribosomal protein S20